jgi:putative peptidoglycan lipid II flippase
MSNASLRLARWLTVAYWVALAVVSHWPQFHIVDNDVVPLGVDKWGHVGCFAMLAWAALASRLFGRGRRGVILGIALLISYTFLDEVTQAMIPGRELSFGDVLASNIGLALGTVAAGFTAWLRQPAQSFVDHARLVSAVTLISRCFGLVRDWALAFALGFGGVYDAFVVAFLIPNLFRRLFGEGALASAFIPHYTRLRQSDSGAAHRFALLVLEILFITLFTIALLICIAIVAWLMGVGWIGGRWQLAAMLTSLTIWYMPLVCVLAVLGAMLQVHGLFGVPAAAPVLLNIFIITAALVGYHHVDGGAGSSIALWIAGAVALAGIVQVAWAVLRLRSAGMSLQSPPPPWRLWREPTVRRSSSALLRQWAPTTVGLAVFQFNVLLDAMIAMGFSGTTDAPMQLFGYSVPFPMSVGAVSVLGASARLYEFPLGVFGIALATAIFPALSAAAGTRGEFSSLLRQGLRLTWFIGLPASIGLVLVRLPLARSIYHGGGQLETDDALRIAWVLMGYAPAVWAYSMNHTLTRAFYAQHNPMTPMKVAAGMVGLNLMLNLLLIWPLGAAGLAWSTALCAMLQSVILMLLVRRYADQPIDAAVANSGGRTIIATIIMAAGVWAVVQPFDVMQLSRAATIGVLLLGTATGMILFAGAARLMRMEELRWLLRRHLTAPGAAPVTDDTSAD